MMQVIREIWGLFVDDGAFAVTILAIIAIAAGVSYAVPDFKFAAGAVLLAGCLGALICSVWIAARASR